MQTHSPAECPLCHGRLERGVLLAPRGIYWDQKVRWSILGSESILSMWAWKMPNAPASRCPTCRLVLFSFA